MKRITLYSASELKAKYPDGFDHALQDWRDDQTEIFWQDETLESLWGLFKAAGVKAVDWSIGAYSYSSIKVEFLNTGWDNERATGELSGQRAIAWLENNLYGPLRIRNNTDIPGGKYKHGPLENLKHNNAYRSCNPITVRPYSIGQIPPCPFTGYCADDAYIEALNKAVRSGDTLKDAFEGLADTARRLLELECEDQASEEYFLDHAEANEFQFTRGGQRVY